MAWLLIPALLTQTAHPAQGGGFRCVLALNRASSVFAVTEDFMLNASLPQF